MPHPAPIPWYPPSPEPEICFSVWPPPSTQTSPSTPPPKSQHDRIKDWFIKPLAAFKGEDSIICLITCCALLETIVRFKLKERGVDPKTKFYDNSQAIRELQTLLEIPTAHATAAFWRTGRNGLLHRGMPNNKKNNRYTMRLSPETPGHVAKLEDRQLTVYIWELREKIVQYLKENGEKLWNNNDNPLIEIVVATR